MESIKLTYTREEIIEAIKTCIFPEFTKGRSLSTIEKKLLSSVDLEIYQDGNGWFHIGSYIKNESLFSISYEIDYNKEGWQEFDSEIGGILYRYFTHNS